jgi:hypothetical protein
MTYSGPAVALSEAFDALAKTGALKPRELDPAPILLSTRDALASLWNKWDDSAFDKLAANNLAMDLPGSARRAEVEKLKKQSGACQAPGPVHPENWLRGRFRMRCDKGEVEAVFTLAPTNPPTVQYLRFEHVGPMSATMRALAEETAARHSCKLGEVLGGDGSRETHIRLECSGGAAMAMLKIDGERKSADFRRAPGTACMVPELR